MKYIFRSLFFILLSTNNVNADSDSLFNKIISPLTDTVDTMSKPISEALNTIIENDLEERSNEILKLFEIVENLKIDKEQLNLIKLKKALYLIKISKNEEGNTLLNEIISENSIWKDAALEISK